MIPKLIFPIMTPLSELQTQISNNLYNIPGWLSSPYWIPDLAPPTGSSTVFLISLDGSSILFTE